MEATETQSSVPVVAIGSSAGGLEALRALLSSLADDTGLAIVVIQHAPIGHDSHLDRILATVTSMRVQMITDGVRVAPDGVYIVPPGFDAALAGECLHLSPRGEPAGNPLGIDFFFTSLAQNRASKAIGVVLSGAGSDGTVGLKAIKGEGGITIVQDPKTARFDGMPRSAIASGIADLILPPEAIAEELARLAKHPYTQAALLPHIADEITGESPPSTYSEDSPLIRKILEILLAQTRIDLGAAPFERH